MAAYEPGDLILLRYFRTGKPEGAVPTHSWHRKGKKFVLWQPAGARTKRPSIDGRPLREHTLEERLTKPRTPMDWTWTGHGIVMIGHLDRNYAIWLFRRDDGFDHWYVNIERAWRPSRYGFDSEDLALDIVVDRSGRWRWKDQDELEAAAWLGVVDAATVAAARAAGERVIAEWPFPTGWEEWQLRDWPPVDVPRDWANSG